jgi:hypothetical protein
MDKMTTMTTKKNLICVILEAAALLSMIQEVRSFSAAPTRPLDAFCGIRRTFVVVRLERFDDDSVVLNDEQEFNHHQTAAAIATTSSSRADFLNTVSSMVVSATAGLASSVALTPTQPSVARGRATLEQAYDRYSQRIIDGGVFYKEKLSTLIKKDDFAGIQNSLQEPPKKSKSDRSKIDGGIAERAALAGEFSDARVLTALDLLAAQFSDNSVSSKTKAMKKEVDTLRSIVQEMQGISKQALGDSGGGGIFGMGGSKKQSKAELSQRMKELYIRGGNAYNQYVAIANEGLPTNLKKLPFL